MSPEIKVWGWLSAHPSQCLGFSEPVPSQCGEAPWGWCLEECLPPFILAAFLPARQSSHPKSIYDTFQIWKSLGISIWKQMSLISMCYFGQRALHRRREDCRHFSTFCFFSCICTFLLETKTKETKITLTCISSHVTMFLPVGILRRCRQVQLHWGSPDLLPLMMHPRQEKSRKLSLLRVMQTGIEGINLTCR